MCVQGYVIYSQRHKLKAELVGKSSTEIRDMKKAGQVRLQRACPSCNIGDRMLQMLRCTTINHLVHCSLYEHNPTAKPATALQGCSSSPWRTQQPLTGTLTSMSGCWSGQEVTQLVEVPEVAFTGDTSSGFLSHPGSRDALRARLLIMELTFLDDDVTIEHAQVPMPTSSYSSAGNQTGGLNRSAACICL